MARSGRAVCRGLTVSESGSRHSVEASCDRIFVIDRVEVEPLANEEKFDHGPGDLDQADALSQPAPVVGLPLGAAGAADPLCMDHIRAVTVTAVTAGTGSWLGERVTPVETLLPLYGPRGAVTVTAVTAGTGSGLGERAVTAVTATADLWFL
jgi:hypothetical protein